ncbi:unnamed protein product [Caenorhabditis angaria]|uniref:IRK_C domain-containing protein n=1 Tax=Caenorhabditis angaria TaxID=860376 RepID=A0A9P1J421_9PELO|nr:unnamed protein product [Caenorhabditis angaria]
MLGKFFKTTSMSLAEELERLSGENGGTKKDLNGWRLSSSAPEVRVQKARLVAKDGKTLLNNIQLPERFKQTYKNWFHLIIECNWRTICLIFLFGFILSWSVFALIYYFISRLKNVKKDESCIANVDTLISAFLFSMESQHTIGYGLRYMTEQCPSAYLTLCVQCVVGVFLQTILAGIVIAKILRPKKRKQEMRFSRMAVIGPLDDNDKRPTLMIRLADIQEKLFLAESHVRLYMASSRINSRGDRELVGVKDMNVGYDSGWDRVLLLWPIIVRHVIDEDSPLHGLTRETILKQEFELIMTVEGIVEATGMTFQARTSFLPDEILWGYRFKPMVLMNEKNSQFEVHYSLFDQTDRCSDFDVQTMETEETEDNENEHHHHNHYASGFL